METTPGEIESLATQVLQALANPSPQLIAFLQQLQEQAIYSLYQSIKQCGQ